MEGPTAALRQSEPCVKFRTSEVRAPLVLFGFGSIVNIRLLLDAGLDLAQASERADHDLVRSVPALVVSATTAQPLGAAALGDDRLLIGADIYAARALASPDEPGLLCVALEPIAGATATGPMSQAEAPVEGAGEFSRVKLRVAQLLRPALDPLIQEVSSYLSDGYRTLGAQVVGVLMERENRMAIRLYTEVRSALDAPIAARVGLYAIVGDRQAMYLLDPAAIFDVFRRITDLRPSAQTSPLSLTALLVSGLIGADETVSADALSRNEPLDVQVASLQYASAPDLSIAEKAWFGTEVHIQPLLREGYIKLIAAYPSNLRPWVAPKLEGRVEMMAAALQDYEAGTRQFLSRGSHTSRRWDTYIGRFIGSVLQGYLPPE